LYFVSYAIYNYLTTPFIFALSGFSVSELELHSELEETWRVLRVVHPDSFPTHTKIQWFYFDSKDFLLRKINHETDVAGGMASHYCFDYKSFDGIAIPTTRRVVGRLPDGSAASTGPTVFGLQYNSAKITDKNRKVYKEGKRVM
jgi:hypothetical protein